MKKILFSLVGMSLLLLTSCAKSGQASITNGDFESGDLTGWTVFADPMPSGVLAEPIGGKGGWFIYQDASELPGDWDRSSDDHEVRAQPEPPQGQYAAITDMNGPGAYILYQDVALDGKYILEYTLFYHNGMPDFFAEMGWTIPEEGIFFTPDSLDYRLTFEPEFPGTPNHQMRLDLLDPGAEVTSVADEDVLAMIFRTEANDPAKLEPKAMSYDLSPWAGQTVRLRFAHVDSLGGHYIGIDNVRLVPTGNQKKE